jgi:hypothetical protein
VENVNDSPEEFALVSMLPGVDGHHHLLLISGLNTQATQGAIDYLTQPERVRDLTAKLRQRSNRRGPWHFQIVTRTEVHDKVPTSASVEAIRVLPALAR